MYIPVWYRHYTVVVLVFHVCIYILYTCISRCFSCNLSKVKGVIRVYFYVVHTIEFFVRMRQTHSLNSAVKKYNNNNNKMYAKFSRTWHTCVDQIPRTHNIYIYYTHKCNRVCISDDYKAYNEYTAFVCTCVAIVQTRHKSIDGSGPPSPQVGGRWPSKWNPYKFSRL